LPEKEKKDRGREKKRTSEEKSEKKEKVGAPLFSQKKREKRRSSQGEEKKKRGEEEKQGGGKRAWSRLFQGKAIPRQGEKEGERGVKKKEDNGTLDFSCFGNIKRENETRRKGGKSLWEKKKCPHFPSPVRKVLGRKPLLSLRRGEGGEKEPRFGKEKKERKKKFSWGEVKFFACIRKKGRKFSFMKRKKRLQGAHGVSTAREEGKKKKRRKDRLPSLGERRGGEDSEERRGGMLFGRFQRGGEKERPFSEKKEGREALKGIALKRGDAQPSRGGFRGVVRVFFLRERCSSLFSVKRKKEEPEVSPPFPSEKKEGGERGRPPLFPPPFTYAREKGKKKRKGGRKGGEGGSERVYFFFFGGKRRGGV